MKEKKSRSGKLALHGDVTLRHLEPVRAKLLELLERHAEISVDCDAISRVDLGLIQLLLAARKSAQAAGKTLTLARPATGALRNALSRGGFIGAASEQNAFWLKGGAPP